MSLQGLSEPQSFHFPAIRKSNPELRGSCLSLRENSVVPGMRLPPVHRLPAPVTCGPTRQRKQPLIFRLFAQISACPAWPYCELQTPFHDRQGTRALLCLSKHVRQRIGEKTFPHLVAGIPRTTGPAGEFPRALGRPTSLVRRPFLPPRCALLPLFRGLGVSADSSRLGCRDGDVQPRSRADPAYQLLFDEETAQGQRLRKRLALLPSS